MTRTVIFRSETPSIGDNSINSPLTLGHGTLVEW